MNPPDVSSTQSTQDSARDSLPVPASLGRESIPTPSASTETAQGDVGPSAVPANTGVPGNIEHRLTFAQDAHEYIREYIRLADQKATFFFTGGTALLAFLYKNDVSSHWLKPPMTWNILDTIAFIAMVALSVAALAALLVVIPRTPGSLRGYLFWEAIAEYDDGRAYADDISQLSSSSLFQIKAEHCHDLARVCRRKYKLLRLALRVGTVGLAAALLVFLFV